MTTRTRRYSLRGSPSLPPSFPLSLSRSLTSLWLLQYILTCVTPRGDLWPILRRFSRFKSLREQLLKDDNPALKSLPFPDRRLLGGSIGEALGEASAKIFGGGPFGLIAPRTGEQDREADDGEATPEVRRRRQLLEQWINETLELCPADCTLLEFLGDDNSVTTTEARKLGIQIVSSAPCRTVTEDSHGDPVALAEHKQRQERHNKQLMAALDAVPVRVSVALSRVPRSGATGLVPLQTDAPAAQPAPAAEPAPAPQPAVEPAPAPAASAGSSSVGSGWGSAFASLKQALSTVEVSVSSGLNAIQKEVQDFSAAARIEIRSGMGPKWSAYVVQCFCTDGECWHVRRSLTEVIKLRNTLLKDGNPAVRAMDAAFPSKLQDAAVMLRPSFVDDDAEDALERRAAIEVWLNEALEACVGDATIEAFLSRESRLVEYTALVRCPLRQELPEPTSTAEDAVEESADSLAVAAGQRFTVTRCVALEGHGQWARCEHAGLVGWLCSQAVDGTQFVSVDPPEADRAGGEENGSDSSESSGEYSSEYETDTDEEEQEEEVDEEAGANADGELTMEASSAAEEVRQAQAARQAKQRQKEEEKAREEAQDGAASSTGGDGSPPALAPPTNVEPNEPESGLAEEKEESEEEATDRATEEATAGALESATEGTTAEATEAATEEATATAAPGALDDVDDSTLHFWTALLCAVCYRSGRCSHTRTVLCAPMPG